MGLNIFTIVAVKCVRSDGPLNCETTHFPVSSRLVSSGVVSSSASAEKKPGKLDNYLRHLIIFFLLFPSFFPIRLTCTAAAIVRKPIVVIGTCRTCGWHKLAYFVSKNDETEGKQSTARWRCETTVERTTNK